MENRNPFQVREVTSRRGGPAKQPLSRDAIVAEALELLLREGLEGMSLRKVAQALDTGPASLYAYVENLQELQALVLDRALAGVETAADGSRKDWRRRLTNLLESYLEVLARRPGLAQLAMNTIAAGPNALRIIEALLGLLEEGGVDRATAAWAVDLLSLYVTAIAVEESNRRQHKTDPLGPIAQVIGAVSPREHPRVHAARDELLSGGPVRMTWALEVLLEGILQTPRPQSKGRPRPPAKVRARKGAKKTPVRAEKRGAQP
ncbi:MAG TPA: TetR/AcrR family transcriptional regulator C-terminal domain-containing protein [Polyangiaceae bacterium]|jgi:AcrR family transcriptional regulator|nr:TetR/AcrR family transcriptional regulator C-terminal domain-containing protein [Polyangiaceae bacterium]